MDSFEISAMAKRMRLMSLEMANRAGKIGAHLGGGLSIIDIFATLYGEILNIDPQNPYDENRDIILLGKGHCVLGYYSVLYERGFLTKEDIDSFEKNGSSMIGHPIKNVEKGIEFSSGSLGMALSVGAGMAFSAKRKNSKRRIYVILGDGECQEGSIWEALNFSVKYKLNNLVIVIDNNKVQSDGFTCEIGGYDNLMEKINAFGCKVINIDGHNINQILGAFNVRTDNTPIVIVADTIKGKGVSFMENDYQWHHAMLNQVQYEAAVKEVSEAIYAED